MIELKRTQIVWLGRPVPQSLKKACKDWSIRVETRNVSGLQEEILSTTLAVLIPTAVLTTVPTKSLANILDLGAICRVVAKGPNEFAAANGNLNERGEEWPSLIGVKQLSGHALVRECVEHHRSPPANLALQIQCEGSHENPPDKDAGCRALLQRMFHRYQKIVLNELPGGRSGASGVWEVAAGHASGHETEPFVIKIGPKSALANEVKLFDDHVRFRVPFSGRPPFAKSGHFEGASKSLLASMFVSRAQRLDDYVRGVHSPEVAITSLFVEVLRNWRSHRQRRKSLLGRVFVEDRSSSKFFPATSRLEEAYELSRNESILSPSELVKALETLPAIDWIECTGHGDLNARNVLVRFGGTGVVLIDFSHVGTMPAARDPARLEVCLAFDTCCSREKFLSCPVLQEIYEPPLVPCLSFANNRDGRVAAIRHIRRQAAGEGLSNAEYEVTVACHLLRYARDGRIDQPNTAIEVAKMKLGSEEERRLRARAYSLASNLISHAARKDEATHAT